MTLQQHIYGEQLSLGATISTVIDALLKGEMPEEEAKGHMEILISKNPTLCFNKKGQVKARLQRAIGKKRARVLAVLVPDFADKITKIEWKNIG